MLTVNGTSKKFGEVIKELRHARRWTQADLAAALGVSPASVAQMELRNSKPHPRTIEKYTEVFGKIPGYERDLSTIVNVQFTGRNQPPHLAIGSRQDWRLCFIEDDLFAWFAPVDPRNVDGDGFDDDDRSASGVPDAYEFANGDIEDQFEIITFVCDEYEAAPDFLSTYELNRGLAAWLWPTDEAGESVAPVMAGTTLRDFCERIWAAGGDVWLRAQKTA